MLRFTTALFLVAQLLVAAALLVVQADDGGAPAVQTEPRLDLRRYAGTWYDVARRPEYRLAAVSDREPPWRLSRTLPQADAEPRAPAGLVTAP